MLHSEQNIDDLEKSLLVYYEDNSETETSSEPIIIIPKQYNWKWFYMDHYYYDFGFCWDLF
jgi:hypothetical protein